MEQQVTSPACLHRTTAVSLPPSSYHEATEVRNSFSTGSIQPIRHLPHRLETGNVIRTRNQTIHSSLAQSSALAYRPPGASNQVPIIAHSFNDYSKPSKLNKFLVEDHKNRLASLARKPFVVHFQSDSSLQDKFSQDEYTGAKGLHHLTRNSVGDSSKFLYGRFQSTCGKSRALKHPDDLQIRQWLQQIHDEIVKDWGSFRFSIQYTIDDQLVISFENKNLPPANALVNYMNYSSTHGIVGSMGFIRRGDRWYVLEGDQVLFVWYAPGVNRGPLKIFRKVSAASRKITR